MCWPVIEALLDVSSVPLQAYVFNGDIYYMASVSSEPLRLTSSDPERRVVNGLSDWTYEGGVCLVAWPEDDCSLHNADFPVLPQTEEVLLTYAAHWWSMDGARLAYLAINNSLTPLVEIPHFLGGLYPTNMVFPYPKVKMAI